MNPLQQLSPESLLEQGTSLVTKTAKAITQQTAATVQTATSQITGQQAGAPSDGGGAAMPVIQRDKQTLDMVSDFYSPSKPQPQHSLPSVSDPTHAQQKQEEKSSTDQKLSDTRQRLSQLLQSQHSSTYFDPTFNRPQQQQEEKPVEKIEREKQEELWEKSEKDKKKLPPMAVQMGAQRSERFPGASG